MLAVRATPILEIPRPPPLPQSGMEAALSLADRGSSPSVAPDGRSTQLPGSGSAAPPPLAGASVKPAAVAAIVVAPAAPRVPREPMSPAAKKRLRTRLTVAAILLVGASSPLWMKHATHLRDRLLAHGKPHAAASAAHAKGSFEAPATATATAAPDDPPPPAEGE